MSSNMDCAMYSVTYTRTLQNEQKEVKGAIFIKNKVMAMKTDSSLKNTILQRLYDSVNYFAAHF